MTRETRLARVAAELTRGPVGMRTCPACGRLRCASGRSPLTELSLLSYVRPAIEELVAAGMDRSDARHRAQAAMLRCAACGLPPDMDEPPADLTFPDLVRAVWAKHEADRAAGIDPVYDDDC